MITLPSPPPAVVATFEVAPPKVFTPAITFHPEPRNNDPDADTALLVMQVNDARQSAECFKLGGYERDAMMKPFSHGGTASMVLGFALQDAALALIEPHLSKTMRNILRVYGSATEMEGLIQTSQVNRALGEFRP